MSNSYTLQVAHFLIQTTDISFRMFQKFRVTPPHFHTKYLPQLPRITAQLPLGTDIRYGKKNAPPPFLSSDPYIFRQILISGKSYFPGSISWRSKRYKPPRY